METQILDKSLREVLEAVSDGVCMTNGEREIVFWNSSAERITGYPSDEVLNRRCVDVLAHADLSGGSLCSENCPMQESVRTGESLNMGEVFLARKDGEKVAVRFRTSVFDVGGMRYCIQIFSESQLDSGGTLAQKLQKMTDASIVDELTGLYDRQFITTILDHQFGLFKRHFQRFGLVLIDIDRFKDINETFGRLAGDEALKSVASILRRSPRAMDFLARFGDDEFIIACPLIELEGLERLSERIVGLVHHSILSTPNGQGPAIEITVSVGGSMVDYKDQSAADIVARAQEAISRVQRDGGNWYALG